MGMADTMNRPDINYPPGDFANRTNESIGALLLDPPDDGVGFSDIFKNSHIRGCVFAEVVVACKGHRENGWDANRFCNGNHFKRVVTRAGRNGPAVYLKCGWQNNIVDEVVICGPYAKHSDWMEGDFSDSYKGVPRRRTWNSGNTYKYVCREDGKPVRVRWNFLRGEKPKFGATSRVRYCYFWSLVTTVYTELKALGLPI